MTDKCPYCGAEVPAEPEGEAKCPVCGEAPPVAGAAPETGIPYEQPPSTTPTPVTPSSPQSEPSGFSLPPAGESTPSGDQYQPPAGGAPAQPFTPPPNYARFNLAWESDASLLRGLWRTIWQVLLHPVNSFRAPALPGQAWAVAFGLILGTFGMAMQVLWSRVFHKPDMIPLPALWWLLLSPLVILAGLYVNAAISHLGLIMVGGAKRGFSATLRVIGYSEASAIFYTVPFLGMAVGGIWGLVILIGGLAGAHGISGWRVVWAYVLLFIIFAAIVAIIVLILGAGMVLGILGHLGAKGRVL
jgi:hypothetical protein